MRAAARAWAGGRNAARAAADVVWPPQCPTCDARTVADDAFCPACWRDAPFVRGLACDGCGAPLPGEEADATRCDGCRAAPPPWARGRAAFVYAGSARAMVLALKHGGREELARPAARWMAAAARDLAAPGTLIVPVPLHWTRRARRRGNQADWLARALARETGLAWDPRPLRRVRRTPSLGDLDPAARAALVGDVFAARAVAAPVLLVDDVMTSGATLGACARALLAAGAPRVDVAVLARAVKGA